MKTFLPNPPKQEGQKNIIQYYSANMRYIGDGICTMYTNQDRKQKWIHIGVPAVKNIQINQSRNH